MQATLVLGAARRGWGGEGRGGWAAYPSVLGSTRFSGDSVAAGVASATATEGSGWGTCKGGGASCSFVVTGLGAGVQEAAAKGRSPEGPGWTAHGQYDQVTGWGSGEV